MSCHQRDRFGRSLHVLVLLGAVVPLIASCGALVAGKPVAGAQQTAQGAHPVQWQPCHPDQAGRGPESAQCGTITVPVDYSKPDGAVAALALIRFPATGAKIGSLVINPGGPGESGVGAAVDLVDALPPQIRASFDVVGFDPRGVASSTPELRCNSDAENDADRADPQVDYSTAGIAHIETSEKEFVQRCVDKMGREFLANIGTASVVKDLEVLRAGLGDDKLTYLGYSYGTLIGSGYAEAYPDKVRAMILDGAIDPTADPIQSNIDQSAAFQKAFDDYAAGCAKDTHCPLGTDPAKAVDVYRSLVDPLVAKPVRTEDPRGLGYSDAITGTIMAMYSPSLWRQLTSGLAELSKGHGDELLALADSYMDRDGQGHYTNANDALIAINCVDQPPITDRAKVIDEDRRIREVAPFVSYGPFTGNAPLDTCAFWPVPPTSTPHRVSAPGLPPTLVVSTTNDPATPYQAGVDLAKQLGGGLLTYDGTQHTVVFEGDDCIDRYAANYLINLTLPPANSTC